MRRVRAFTLIELLVVISIIALLSSIVLASLNTAREKARIASAKQFSATIYHGIGDDVMGIWDFDDCSGTTAADRSGGGSPGTLRNGPLWSTDTPLSSGCSISFDGVNDYVDMGANKPSPKTVSAWVYLDPAFPSDERDIFTNWGAGGANNLVFKVENFLLSVNANSFSEFFGASTPLPTGKWYHVAYVNNIGGGKSKLFLDGKEVASAAATTIGTGTNNWYIGANDGGTARYWKGQIDDVRIYSRAITALEVEKLFAQGAAKHDVAVK